MDRLHPPHIYIFAPKKSNKINSNVDFSHLDISPNPTLFPQSGSRYYVEGLCGQLKEVFPNGTNTGHQLDLSALLWYITVSQARINFNFIIFF